jgi:hypothetical protein
LFHRNAGDETNLLATKPFWAFGAELRKRLMVIKPTTNTAPSAAGTTGDSQMRTISFIFAFALLMAGSSMAGSAETDLPGVGTFSYNGPTVTTSASHALVVAAR